MRTGWEWTGEIGKKSMIAKIESFSDLDLPTQFRIISQDPKWLQRWKDFLRVSTDDLWDVQCEVAHHNQTGFE